MRLSPCAAWISVKKDLSSFAREIVVNASMVAFGTVLLWVILTAFGV
jgi:hypothetical protein